MRTALRRSALLGPALLLLLGCPGGETKTDPGSISGTVVDASTEAAVAGASVTLTPGGASVVTDASGAFAFHQLDPGVYQVAAEKAGYDAPAPTSVRVTSGETASAAVRLTATVGHLAGTVTDATAGTPVAGATVTTDPATAECVTDAEGRFSFDLPAGLYAVRAVAEGYDAAVSSPAQVSAGGQTTVDLPLSPAITYDSTCEGCHLQLAELLASLDADPLPEDPTEAGSAGEG